MSKKFLGMQLARDAMHMEDQRRLLAVNSEMNRQWMNQAGGLNIQGPLVQPQDSDMIHIGDITYNGVQPSQDGQTATANPAVSSATAGGMAAPAPSVAPAAATTVPAVSSGGAVAAVAAAPTPLSKAAIIAAILGGSVLTGAGSALWSYFSPQQPASQTVSVQPSTTVTTPATQPNEYGLELLK